MDNNAANLESTTNEVDDGRRSALLAMAKAMAYVPPAVATFAMAGLSVREAHAYVTNLPN